ncbi:hypothetical protein [Nocardia fluminea]|uniref:hypothetical protein n=1 Tax=Nocardia fluminea TaxID=134984 RepID=UPI003D0D7227
MTLDETTKLLARITASDNRTVGQANILAWHEEIGDLEFADAYAAVVEFFANSEGIWLTSGHVRAIARKNANDRVERASVAVEYRHEREDARDERLAELCGGTRAALELTPARANSGAGSGPAKKSTRAKVMGQVRTLCRSETKQEKALRILREWRAEQSGVPESVA